MSSLLKLGKQAESSSGLFHNQLSMTSVETQEISLPSPCSYTYLSCLWIWWILISRLYFSRVDPPTNWIRLKRWVLWVWLQNPTSANRNCVFDCGNASLCTQLPNFIEQMHVCGTQHRHFWMLEHFMGTHFFFVFSEILHQPEHTEENKESASKDGKKCLKYSRIVIGSVRSRIDSTP